VKVSFEISPRDVRYFRDRLQRIRGSLEGAEEVSILLGADKLIRDARATEPPQFVLERLVTLERLLAILNDGEWRLEGRDRARILDALAYFVDPEDMIPDRLPGIGYIDDAIMVELISEELKHEIKAYEDFCEFRKAGGKKDPDKLENRRTALQARMRRRTRRDRDSLRSGGARRSPLKLW
jgi:uncharacterized membrane protein YkvA (DUF1232 family)